MDKIVLVIVLAVIVEALVQYGKTIIDAFVNHERKTAITQLTAMAISIILCFSTGADMFHTLGVVFDWPTIGVVLTGIFASRGSNYVSDLVKKVQNSSLFSVLDPAENDANNADNISTSGTIHNMTIPIADATPVSTAVSISPNTSQTPVSVQ